MDGRSAGSAANLVIEAYDAGVSMLLLVGLDDGLSQDALQTIVAAIQDMPGVADVVGLAPFDLTPRAGRHGEH